MFRVANTPARTCLFSLLEHLSCFSRLAVKLSHPFLRCQRTKVGKQLGSDLHLDGVTIPAGFRENTPLGKHAVALRWRDTNGAEHCKREKLAETLTRPKERWRGSPISQGTWF